jgi:hypothetical protein
LNRTYALFKTKGVTIAIAEAKKLSLEQYSYYHSLLGKLHIGLDVKIAKSHFKKALSIAKSVADKNYHLKIHTSAVAQTKAINTSFKISDIYPQKQFKGKDVSILKISQYVESTFRNIR